MNNSRKIAIIAALGKNRELGRNGDLVWHISADLKNFKRLTSGHTVIMGRKTWESLPKRPLPGRNNIVLTRSNAEIEGATRVPSVESVLSSIGCDLSGLPCESDSTVFIIGGAQVYSAFLPHADILYLTKVDSESGDGVDTWFPEYENDWHLEAASDWETDSNGVKYRFETWIRNEY